jgi:putative transposase
MNQYNPNIHHRRSIRLKGYDYSQVGLYFITICVQDRARLFGEISTGKMTLNDAGKMVERWYFELENKYPIKVSTLKEGGLEKPLKGAKS